MKVYIALEVDAALCEYFSLRKDYASATLVAALGDCVIDCCTAVCLTVSHGTEVCHKIIHIAELRNLDILQDFVHFCRNVRRRA